MENLNLSGNLILQKEWAPCYWAWPLKCIQLTSDTFIVNLKATPDTIKAQASALLTFFKHDQV